jgi:hypothetical protein
MWSRSCGIEKRYVIHRRRSGSRLNTLCVLSHSFVPIHPCALRNSRRRGWKDDA